jgi:hypothetical protein
MSKPEPTGESLESILAAIRRSLSEQSTEALEEERATAPVKASAVPPPIASVAAPVAGEAGAPPPVVVSAPAEPPQAEAAPRPAADPPPPQAVEPLPPPVETPGPDLNPAATQKDPLWFLGRTGVPEAKDGTYPKAPDAPPLPGPADQKPLFGGGTPSRADSVRAPLPPFFGSSAGAAKSEAALLGAGPAAVDAGYSNGHDMAHNGSPLFGHAPAGYGQGPVNGAPQAPADTLQVHALEAMVAELLRPMLRRWLDENMPRLVSAALKAEAETLSRRDPKKP